MADELDLNAELREFTRLIAELPEWVGGTMREPDLAVFARRVTGVALRRAIAAEAEVAQLRQQVQGYCARIVAQSELLTKVAQKKERNVMTKPKIVCLCGSTRFGEAFRQASRSETLAGHIVLSVGLLGHEEGLDMNGPVKAMLDELHLRKIDLADEVLFLNVGGYIGQSTARELAYAREAGKVVRFLEEPT